jgi:hypothetical protein
MNATEVDALVRSVIVHLGLPFAVLSVVESPAKWNIEVRAATGGVVRFSIPAGRPLAMRIAIQEQLEAEL